MIGFVLSGGANRGALQVGALQSLVAHGIKANLVAGTSAGALNGVYYACDPTPAGLEQLAQKWLNTRKNDVFPGNKLTMAWRVLTGQDSLVSGDNFRRTLAALHSAGSAHLPRSQNSVLRRHGRYSLGDHDRLWR